MCKLQEVSEEIFEYDKIRPGNKARIKSPLLKSLYRSMSATLWLRLTYIGYTRIWRENVCVDDQ